MEKLKKQKGVTMISLVVTIIILVILSTMITHTGMESIRNSRFERFKNELEVLQKNVDVWYEETIELSSDEIMMGKKISGERKDEFESLISKVTNIVNNENNIIIKTDINRYRYFGESEFSELQIEGIENEYIIDIKSQVVILIDGFEYDNVKYYVLDQIRNVTRGGKDIGEIVKISSFSIENNIQMLYQDTRTIVVEVKPENASEELIWTSSNSDIVSIEELTGTTKNTAQIKANGTGKAIIKVSNKNLTINKECMITVTKQLVTTLTAIQSQTIEAADKYGNNVVVPKGFRYVEGETIKEGIVVEDEEGNQFVWIPVSDISNTDKNPLKIDENLFVIILGRYIKNTNGLLTFEQVGKDFSDETEITIGTTKYKELVNSRIGVSSTGSNGKNATSFDLEGFIKSVEKNKGFFYARYEASKGTDGKVKSKANQTAWTELTQIEASNKSRTMYNTNNDVKTDLINSYAWGTVLNYITQIGGANYMYKNNITTSILKTGQSGDKICNIYDMAGNLSEWTTETAIENSQDMCTYIGGSVKYPENTMDSRFFADSASNDYSISFRTIMYIDN